MAVLTLALVFAAACGGGDDAAGGSGSGSRSEENGTSDNAGGNEATGEHIKVGVVLPLTGDFGTVGLAAQQGLNVAAKRINADGGVLDGQPIELVYRDSQSDVNKGVLAARDLLDNECPCAFVYPDTISTIALGVLPITTEDSIVTITAASAIDIGDASKYPYSFQLSYTSDIQLVAIGSALKEMDAIKIGTLFATHAAGTERSKKAPAAFEELGLEVVGSESFEPGATDVTVQVQKLRDAGADGIACGAAAGENGVIMNAVRDLGWDDVVVMCDTTASAGGAIESVPSEVGEQYHYLGALGATRQGDTVESDLSEFIDDLKEEGDFDSLDTRMLNHDILQIAAWAVDDAGTIDGQAVKASLENIGTAGPELDEKLIYFPNPQWTADEHSTGLTDFSNFWAIVNVSDLIDGTYVGEPLTLH